MMIFCVDTGRGDDQKGNLSFIAKLFDSGLCDVKNDPTARAPVNESVDSKMQPQSRVSEQIYDQRSTEFHNSFQTAHLFLGEEELMAWSNFFCAKRERVLNFVLIVNASSPTETPNAERQSD
jgi:hypothetical protein